MHDLCELTLNVYILNAKIIYSWPCYTNLKRMLTKI